MLIEKTSERGGVCENLSFEIAVTGFGYNLTPKLLNCVLISQLAAN
jgi:hypothetical protein